jgi:hypothetical protein
MATFTWTSTRPGATLPVTGSLGPLGWYLTESARGGVRSETADAAPNHLTRWDFDSLKRTLNRYNIEVLDGIYGGEVDMFLTISRSNISAKVKNKFLSTKISQYDATNKENTTRSV